MAGGQVDEHISKYDGTGGEGTLRLSHSSDAAMGLLFFPEISLTSALKPRVLCFPIPG